MKKNVLLFIGIMVLIACNQSGNTSENEQDSIVVAEEEQEYTPEIEMTSDKNMKSDFFIISISGTEDMKEAVSKVKKLKAEGHPAGYLWLPDYESLSDKELFSVFVGPFSGMYTCIKYLQVYKKIKKDAYVVKVQHKEKRVAIHNKFDIRINDMKQNLILTYSTPEDEEEYAEDGGEDWGWFVNDVQTYFNKHYPDKVLFSSVYYSWFTKADIKKLKNELELDGFGYILIKGKEKKFVGHDMPDGVISSVCEFFELEHKGN